MQANSKAQQELPFAHFLFSSFSLARFCVSDEVLATYQMYDNDDDVKWM